MGFRPRPFVSPGLAEWNDIMEKDGVAFQDAKKVEWFLMPVLRGVDDGNTGPLYQ
ncbi:hypothetical protein H0H92_014500, partial [Tricholoma furcatifolium]